MEKENELNLKEKKSDTSNFVEKEPKITASITDSAHVQTVNPVTEGGGFQQEVNENITQSINSIINGGSKVKTITSSINTINSTLEGGTTQQQVNEKNKQNIDNLNSEFNDVLNGNTLIKTTSSSVETINSTAEGGTTQQQVNEKNKQNIDNLNDSIIAIDDKIDNLDFDMDTSKINTTNTSLENGSTQQEINIKNKVNFDSLNSEISDINDKMESFGEVNTTSSINAVDTTLEGGINQKEINEVNKQDIDNINNLIDDISSKIDDLDIKTNTENVFTVDNFFEGGPNQKEVNEANKEKIFTLNSEIIKVNSEITEINEKIDCMECGCDSGCDCDDITTSTINTANSAAEGGTTQEIVNENNKAAIDNLNAEVDTLNEEVDDLISNGIPTGDTSTIDTASPSTEGGLTQKEVNEANKEAIDELNAEVDDIINNGVPAGNTAVIDTASPSTEGGTTQKEVNEANKAAIDDLNDEFDTLNAEVDELINNGVPVGDTSTIDTADSIKEGGTTQQEVNEANKEAIDELNAEVDDIINNGVPAGNTAVINTASPSTEGGTTQKEVNEANKEAIDDINDQLDDLSDPITSGVNTVDPAAEGGTTQQEVNEANKEAIDELNAEVDDIINNGVPAGNTAVINTASPSTEGGATQKEVNEANKEAIDDINDQLDDLSDPITSGVNTVDPAAEGGTTQQEVNEANKEAIDELNAEVDNIIDNGVPAGNTAVIDTASPSTEGGTTQKEVNEANKAAIDDINDQLDDLSDPITSGVNTVDPAAEGGTTQQEVNEANKEAIDDINDQLDDLTDPITSGVNTVDPAAEGGANQEIVNKKNKTAIDDLNNEFDNLNTKVDDILDGDTSDVPTENPDTEGGTTQKEVNEANKEAIDQLNTEVDNIIDNGVPAGNTAVIETASPSTEGGTTQKEVNEANKEAIDEMSKSIGDIWADLNSIADCTDCPIDISSAIITNVVTVDNDQPDESNGSITFDVNIHNFLHQGTVVLNPAINTSPIDLIEGDNIGLVFTDLPTGIYIIEVYDGTILATSQNNVPINEPTIEISNETIIDGMGNGAANGSGSATIDISGYTCALTAVINPDPNSVNPVPLQNGTNQVSFDNLPPGNYVVNIKCDNVIIDTLNFTIHDGPTIPDNDGFDDVVVPDDIPFSGNGTANYDFNDYEILITRIETTLGINHALDIGINMEINGLYYHLGNAAADSGTIKAGNLSLEMLSAKDYTIIIQNTNSSNPDYRGIDFIKGYKTEIVPLLDAEVNVGINGIVNLKQPVSNFTHFIIKSIYKNSKIEYGLYSLEWIKKNVSAYLVYHDYQGWTRANFTTDYSTFKVIRSKSNSKPFAVNMVWGININNLQDATNKTFDPKSFSILFATINSSHGIYVGVLPTQDIKMDGKTHYSFLRWDNTNYHASMIFNADGTHQFITGKDGFNIVKLEGLILPSIRKAYISNLVTDDVSSIEGTDGKITFNVNISGFEGNGTAVLEPTENTSPIALNKGDNIGLIFDNLPSALYKIKILDEDELVTLENNIPVLEPNTFASNTVIVDSMGNGAATGSASTKVEIIGFKNGNAIINPNPNNINPIPLNNGNNEVIFDNLPPDNYNLEVKNDDNIIKRFNFKINDGPIIPLNDGLSDLDVMEDEANLSGGITQDNLTDYTFVFVNTLVNNSEYGTTLLLGTNLKIAEENYNLGHEWTALEIAKRSQQFLTLKLNAKNNYSLDHAGDVYNGINFIKGYKKEVTPLLNSELSLKKGEIANLDVSLAKFNYIITKSTLNDKFIEYTLTSLKDLDLYKNKYWAGYGRTDNLYVNLLDNNTKILVWSDGNSNNCVNMLWGVHFNNLQDLTNKVFNPKVYTLLLVHFNLNDSAYIGLVYTANVVADGKTKYYLTIINVLTYIIFNEDGTYTLGDVHNFTKIEGLSFDTIAKANIKNLIISDVTVNAGNDGSITFDVSISAFKGKGTAVLNPAGNTLPIDLNDGDNIGLNFNNLTSGSYKIEIYDDENLVTKREDIIVSEPVILLKNR